MDLPEPAPTLATAAVYERTVRASLERVIENVLDWEHLPWLHARAFASIEKLDAGAWGWRARLGGAGGGADSVIELLLDPEARRYVVRTGGEPGVAPASEIWTSLEPGADADSDAEDATRVRVEFRVRPLDEEVLAAVGRIYVDLYTMLWDEDEEMMCERSERLREQASPPPDSPVDLGTADELRARLPIDVVFGGRRFRVVERGGRFVARAAVCPHMLGPLFPADGDDATLECPWHGYRFDATSGRSCDGRGLRLPKAPEVSLDAVPGRCTLVAAH